MMLPSRAHDLPGPDRSGSCMGAFGPAVVMGSPRAVVLSWNSWTERYEAIFGPKLLRVAVSMAMLPDSKYGVGSGDADAATQGEDSGRGLGVCEGGTLGLGVTEGVTEGVRDMVAETDGHGVAATLL